ncbi:hypothetical protein COE15_16000 [Bacillus cereus]|uniref:DUF2185 domain-containing protein n=1 Tax=Bacillus sp. AFS023182 TaxID=2033492 RepID=UPI000BF9E436|nr:DUF2185 domain-containing protein [Bacillus sp. AFS023182]PFD99986.1 hypothetical protein CN288_19030 [Bacillus sp. AFS023182]PGX98348.1 hypothetical protein COE15_16000 [Bacillus cereus]
MKKNNSEYGGFVVSKNILAGKPVRYSFREKGSIPQLNGWNLYSIDDTDEYVNHAENFIILNAESIFKIAPVMFEIFAAPYGTDLCWLYEEGVHIGFYDLVADKEVTINEVIKQN